MKGRPAEQGEIRVVVGNPVPSAEEDERGLVLAAALAARAGTRDPVDLALLGAAAHREDLRHYRQLEYAPPSDPRRYSVTRVRHLDTDAEELIARGDLEEILYLCRADEASRYRAALQANIAEAEGFTPIGVARGTCRLTDGCESWHFLGQVPVRATRTRMRRHEEPGAFRYVRVWDWELRILHWTAAFAIIALCITGWFIGSSRLAPADGVAGYYIGYLRLGHFLAGWLLLATALLRVAGLFLASTKYQRWRALVPLTPPELKNLLLVMRNYLFCIFEHGPHYIGHNPLQQVAYTGIYLMGLVAVVTGFGLYGLSDPGNPIWRPLLWLVGIFGVPYVRLVHLFMMWIFLAFVPIHVYLSIRADTVEREGAISSIFSGGRWCRKGTRFEDG